MRRRFSLLFLVLPVGCGTVDPRPEQEEVRRFIRDSTGEADVFDPQHDSVTEAEIEDVLADGLLLAEATRLALLNNRRLQAGFSRLGVGKAELVQAGLLRNPSLSLGFLLPSGGGGSKLTFELAQSVVELWELPRREALARAELAQDVLELSRFAAELVVDVRVTYLQAVAARELIATARAGQELAQRSLESILALVAGGVATEADAALARTAAAQTELVFLQTVLAEAGAKRALAALLSLERDLAPVELSDPLPEPDDALGEREMLVERARTARLDLRVSEQAQEAARARLELEQSRFLPGLDLTLSAERPELGNEPDLLIGPGASVVLPVFDTNRARESAARYELEARGKEHDALLAEVVQAVRTAADRDAAAARTARHVERELLPHAEHSHDLAQRSLALGSVTVLATLEGQRAVLAARESLVRSRLEAALAQVELERALGAPLRPSSPVPRLR